MTVGPTDASRPSRRELLAALAALGVTAACRVSGDDTAPPTTTTASTTTTPPVGPYPFTLGVASGDPTDDGVVLWTRVERDGDRSVEWEVALDPDMDAVVATGAASAPAGDDHTARVIVHGLAPDTEHWFRFRLDGHATAPARTRTAPAAGSTPERVVVAQVSCQRRSSGYWTAYDDLVAEAPDLVVHCGDYLYEVDRGPVRPDDRPEAVDLDTYRLAYRTYRSDPALQAAHAVAPFVVTWDDHEVADNWQGDDPRDGEPSEAFVARRTAAHRAWWEYQPTRLPRPEGPSTGIHRTVDWGGLARFAVLDTRSVRDDQPCGDDLGPRCDASDQVTMLGPTQEAWLSDAATGNEARWFVPVSSVMVQPWQLLPGGAAFNLDGWDGYPAARQRLLAALAAAGPSVVLTGDVHSSWVADLHADPTDRSTPVVAVELVGPGISSEVPDRLRGRHGLIELQNPHLRWAESSRRGWVRHEITPDQWTATYRLVDDADVPNSAVTTAQVVDIERDRIDRGVTRLSD